MDYPKFIASNQKEESIRIQKVKTLVACWYMKVTSTTLFKAVASIADITPFLSEIQASTKRLNASRW